METSNISYYSAKIKYLKKDGTYSYYPCKIPYKKRTKKMNYKRVNDLIKTIPKDKLNDVYNLILLTKSYY